MHIVLFEDEEYRNLLPLTYWRGVFELRCGCGSLADHVRAAYPSTPLSLFVRPALAAVVTERVGLRVNVMPDAETILFLNGRALLREPLGAPDAPAAAWVDDRLLWARLTRAQSGWLTPETLLDADATRRALANVPEVEPSKDAPPLIRYPWDLVHKNSDMIVHAWRRFADRGIEGELCDGVHVLDRGNVWVGQGSRIKPGVVLDAEDGPILIGNDVTIQPNATVQGPTYIGDGSLVQTGVAVRSGTSIGPVCKIGGEIEGSILHGYSNKQHDGFLGHAYVGEFVNLAADTVNSDLKNTYGRIRVPINGVEVDSGQMFVGLTIGDHSKTGIGQLFPTGAVVGFGSSVATSNLAPKFIGSFRWVTDEVDEPYNAERCLAVARTVMARRNRALSAAEEALFRKLPAIAREHERTAKREAVLQT